jgi:hypothetical protein
VNAHAESESTLLSTRRVLEHLKVLRSTSEVTWSVWEDWCGFQTDLHFADFQVIAHQVHCLWVNNSSTTSSIAIQVHQQKSNHNGSGLSHPTGG